RMADVRFPVTPLRRFSHRIELSHEIQETGHLLPSLRVLLRELDGYLQATQQGVSRLQLQLFHRDRTSTAVQLGFAEATRDAARIDALLEQKLENVRLPAPVLEAVLLSEEMQSLA